MIYFTAETIISISDQYLRIAMYTAYNGKCFYTGRDIDAESMHIDHIIPKSKGGKDCVLNYVPTFPELNLIKSDMYDGRFVDVVTEVVRCVFAERVVKCFNNIKANPRNYVSAKQFFDEHDCLSSLGVSDRQLVQQRIRNSGIDFVTKEGGKWRFYERKNLTEYLRLQGFPV